MKNFLLTAFVIFLVGCGTTFQQRKEVYVKIFKKAASIVKTVGPVAAQIYLDKKVADGEITEEEKHQILTVASSMIEDNKIKEPENVRVIHGEYNNKIEPDFSKDTYNHKQKIKRECQLVADHFFTYMRHRNRVKELEFIQKRIK